MHATLYLVFFHWKPKLKWTNPLTPYTYVKVQAVVIGPVVCLQRRGVHSLICYIIWPSFRYQVITNEPLNVIHNPILRMVNNTFENWFQHGTVGRLFQRGFNMDTVWVDYELSEANKKDEYRYQFLNAIVLIVVQYTKT